MKDIQQCHKDMHPSSKTEYPSNATKEQKIHNHQLYNAQNWTQTTTFNHPQIYR